MKRKSVTQREKERKKKPMNEPIVIDINSPIDNDGTPLRAVFCLKRKSNMREIEEKEDCFILDFDPCDDTVFNKVLDDADISVISEKGQVACRDYPHPRHLCAKNVFDQTPHDRYCELCYCFVCDLAAPCKSWTGQFAHCHAFDNEAWKSMRKTGRVGKK